MLSLGGAGHQDAGNLVRQALKRPLSPNSISKNSERPNNMAAFRMLAAAIGTGIHHRKNSTPVQLVGKVRKRRQQVPVMSRDQV
jgi:hypothetical protein